MKSPLTGRTFTPQEERLVTEDGFPAFLILNAEERHAAWERNPPKSMPRFADPRIEQDRAMREEEKRIKAQTRIVKMKAGLARKQTTPFSTKGLRWDTNNSKWIPDGLGTTSTTIQQTQEDLMPKFVIKPLDKFGHAVMRAVTSIQDTATDTEIEDKVKQAVKRGGSKVVAVTLSGADGQPTKSWAVDEKGEVGTCEVEAFQSKTTDEAWNDQTAIRTIPADAIAALAEATTPDTGAAEQSEENNMAKKTKSKTAKKTGVKKERKPGVIAAVIDMISRDNGATIAQIVAVLVKKFPDRKEKSMTSTAKIQANKNATSKDKNASGDVVYFKKR